MVNKRQFQFVRLWLDEQIWLLTSEPEIDEIHAQRWTVLVNKVNTAHHHKLTKVEYLREFAAHAVLEMFRLRLRHLSTREVKHFLTEGKNNKESVSWLSRGLLQLFDVPIVA